MSGRVLLVEDSPTQAEALREVLEDAGFEVTHAASGEDALSIMTGEGYDLIVSDVMMPGISGYDLCRMLKASPATAGIPFVLLTSLSDPMAIVRGLECGADNYVTKPYTPSYLLARIRNTLDKSLLRPASKTSVGVNVRFLDTTFTITSDRDQILDLFISSIEDVIRANDALHASQRDLAEAQQELEQFADRMALEAQLSSEKYAALMRAASDAIFVLDDQDRIQEANIRATELLGLSADDLRQRSIHDLTPPASQAVLRDHFVRLQQFGRVSSSEIEFRTTGMDSIYCDVSTARVGTDQGDLTLAILHDVTERRAAAEQLRLKEVQLANAQQVAHLGSFELEVATNHMTISDELYRILGRTPDTVAPSMEGLLECVHHDDRPVAEEVARAILGGAAVPLHAFRIVREDGAIRHVQIRAELRGRDGSARLLGTVQDVTDWKRLEQQLQQSQKMEAMGRLAGGIAHDFNNLLTVITSYSDFVLADLEPVSQAHADLSEIRRAAETAATLTRQLLAFSRKQVIQPRAFDIDEAVRGFEKVLRRIVRENIELVVQLGGAGGHVLADPGQIEQVLLNLVVNAQDAMPQGGRLAIETGRVELASGQIRGVNLPGGAYQRISVSDTGVGMDEETMAQMFEPFFTTKPVGQGTGLGLSTVHGIVKQAGGEIAVSSNPGRGSTFEIFLPLIQHGIPATDRRVPDTARAARTATILIVEDEPGLRVLARRVLEGNGYEVLEARNGDEALSLCSQGGHDIDLILTDVVMPGIDVREMVERLSGMCENVKVVYMSGYTDDDIMRHGLSDPNVAFLQKPFSPETLASKVRQVLGDEARQKIG